MNNINRLAERDSSVVDKDMKRSKDALRLVEEGIALRQQGEYREAARRFEWAAELGSAEALYLAGENVKDTLIGRGASICPSREIMLQDAEYRQFDYFFRSAEAGYPPAMLRVAKIYHRGCVLFDPNPQKAVFWYTKALRTGAEEARTPLADCYEYGFGVDKNTETADKIRKGTSNF